MCMKDKISFRILLDPYTRFKFVMSSESFSQHVQSSVEWSR